MEPSIEASKKAFEDVVAADREGGGEKEAASRWCAKHSLRIPCR